MADERSFLAAMGRNAALGSPPATARNHRPRLCIADSISAFLSTRNDYSGVRISTEKMPPCRFGSGSIAKQQRISAFRFHKQAKHSFRMLN